MIDRRALLAFLASLPVPAFAQVPGLPQMPSIPSLPQVKSGGQPTSTTPPTTAPARSNLSTGEIGSGLKEALRVGTERTVSRLGRDGGYLNDKDVRIPLPGPLASVSGALKTAGMGGALEDLERRMNRAAETAAPQAGRIFGDAIQKMSIADANQILRGPNDAATQYFKRETTGPLTSATRPIVDKELQGAGAVTAFQAVTKQASSVPLIGGSLGNTDLTGFVVEKALAGLFLYLGREEAAIRQNPAQRSTELLKKVFG